MGSNRKKVAKKGLRKLLNVCKLKKKTTLKENKIA